MNVLLDDLLDGVVHKVQESLVPTIEVVTKKAAHELKNRRQTPPSSIDLLYLTDRLIVSSQPAVNLHPSYTDSGRDDQSTCGQVSKSVPCPETGNSTNANDNSSSDEAAILQQLCSETKGSKENKSFQALKSSTNDMRGGTANMSECGVTLEEKAKTKESCLDMTDKPQSNLDVGTANIADLENIHKNANEEKFRASALTNEKEIDDPNEERFTSVTGGKNLPATMTSFLDKRHGSENYLAFSLTDEPPDDRTLILFRRQIVQLGWWSPCTERSETPSVSNLLRACYAIHAYLQLEPENVALVYCCNGKTRTAITVACYMKFAGIVKTCQEGFLRFLSKRGIEKPETTWRQLPPSLRLFFQQFDTALSIGGYLNRNPLRLRAIALQGVPVEDKPCLDIWDSSQRHVYSSHPEMWNKNEELRKSLSKSSQWIDEEGFYEVNACLDGDFLMLCRFGGDFAKDTTTHDPSKILFRYTNNTGFLGGGCPYELPSTKVDLTRRYALHLDHEDFLLTLIFQADWEEMEVNEHQKDCLFTGVSHEKKEWDKELFAKQVWRSHDPQAFEEGLKVIFQHHSAHPDANDIKTFRSLHREQLFERCPSHLICLALQLTNLNHSRTNDLLLSSPSFSWWHLHSVAETSEEKRGRPSGLKYEKDQGTSRADKDFETHGKRLQNMLGMLDTIDVSRNLDRNDIENFMELGARQKRHLAVLDSQGTPKRRSSSIWLWKHSLMEGRSDDAGWMVPGIAYPHAGDIVRSFGAESSGLHRQFPIPTPGPLSLPRVPHHQDLNPFLRGGRVQANHYDRQRDISTQVLSQMQHTGLTLPDLLELLTESQQWDGISFLARSKGKFEKGRDEAENSVEESKESSMNRKSKEQKEKEWNEARSAEEKERIRKRSAGGDPGEQPAEQQADPTDALTPLKDDPEYAKYFKMLKMGMPLAQVEHAVKRDEKDPMVLKLNPEKSLDEQIPDQPEIDGEDIPLKEDPDYEKYFRMLKMGLPKDAVKNALVRDGKDSSVIDLDPMKSLRSQRAKHCSPDDPPLRDDPNYQKYFKMLKMGMPLGAVKNALVRDGKDPSIVDLDPGRSLKSQTLVKEDDGIALKDDPEYRKYFKMMAMGLPVDAVKNALMRDGKDPSVLDLDPNKSVQFQLGEHGKKDTGVPLKNDPEYAKYFKMLGMGLPMGAVKNALERDGKDPHILNLDPEKSVAYQLKESAASKKSPTKMKKKVRRKKIYWNPIDPGKLKKDSMWHIVRDAVNMTKLTYDQKEFEELFTESADPKDAKKKQKPEKSAKKLVQVIDPKRSMNGGIILARLKIEYSKIADIVNKMERSKFDSTQLSALKEFLPNADERRGLIGYMQNSKISKETLYGDLSETEKYMYTMIDVTEASEKMDAMLFRCVFKNRFDDVNAGIKTLNSACDQLRSSEKLRKLMAMILTVVNEINTGGEGNMAVGFTLDALLKLNEAKAFDKKTSVLHYVVKLVKKNDDGLLTFSNGISSVIPAESVLLDSLASEVKALGQELAGVQKTVQTEAARLEEAGELKPMTLEDLKEQRTSVRQVGNVSQFNKMNHHTGRTPMERFMVNAKCSCDQAINSIEDVRKKYLALLEYFGEDENMATSDFFGILRRFMREFQKAVDQVEAIEKKEAKEKKRAAARAAKAAAKTGDRTSGRNKKGRRGGKLVLPNAPQGRVVNPRKNKETREAAKTGIHQTADCTIDSKHKTRSDLLSAMAAAAASRKGREGKDPSIATNDIIGTIKEVKASSNAITEETDSGSGNKTSNVKAGTSHTSLPGNQDLGAACLKSIDDSEHRANLHAPSLKSETDTAKSMGKPQLAYATVIIDDENEAWEYRAKTKQHEGNVEVQEPDHSPTNGDQVAQAPVGVTASIRPRKEKQHKDYTSVLINEKSKAEISNLYKTVGTGEIDAIKSNEVSSKIQLSQVGGRSDGDLKDSLFASTAEGTNKAMEVASNNNDHVAWREIEQPRSGFNHGTQLSTGSSLGKPNYRPTEPILDVKSLERRARKSTDTGTPFASQDEHPMQIHVSILDVGDPQEKGRDCAATAEHRTIGTEHDISVLDTKLDHDDPLGATQSETGETNRLMSNLGATKDEKQMKELSGSTSVREHFLSPPLPLQSTDSPTFSFAANLAAVEPKANSEGNHVFMPTAARNSPKQMENEKAEAPATGFDDLSVAESIPKRTMEVRMSKTWVDGEEITNWMPWADEVIKACDSDSVVGFEVPRDLNDGLDFDDDSTIASGTSFASNFDDLSVASGINTPGKMAPFQRPTTSPFDPYIDKTEPGPNSFFGSVGGRLETHSPFEDSRSLSANSSHPPFQHFESTKLSLGTSTPRRDVGLDSGLSFGADVGLDDGLGGFGAVSNIDINDDNGRNGSKPSVESKRKNNWFPWGGGGSEH